MRVWKRKLQEEKAKSCNLRALLAHISNRVPKSVFPSKLQAGLPATNLNSAATGGLAQLSETGLPVTHRPAWSWEITNKSPCAFPSETGTTQGQHSGINHPARWSSETASHLGTSRVSRITGCGKGNTATSLYKVRSQLLHCQKQLTLDNT